SGGWGSPWKKPVWNIIPIHASVIRYAVSRRRSSGQSDGRSGTWIPSRNSSVRTRWREYAQESSGRHARARLRPLDLRYADAVVVPEVVAEGLGIAALARVVELAADLLRELVDE